MNKLYFIPNVVCWWSPFREIYSDKKEPWSLSELMSLLRVGKAKSHESKAVTKNHRVKSLDKKEINFLTLQTS